VGFTEIGFSVERLFLLLTLRSCALFINVTLTRLFHKLV